jgi:multidrug efflux pump
MTLPRLSIRRPVLATVLNLIVVLLGLVAYSRLPVRQVPKIDAAVVSVSTFYPGANATVIESTITKPIEDALAGLEGVDFMTSESRPESSNVNIVFTLDRDPDDAAADVRDRVNQAKQALPLDAREPIVQKQEADAQPIIYLAFSSDRHDRVEIADVAHRLVKDRLQAIPGVAEAQVYGARYAMRIWLKPDRLAGYGMTAADVENALRSQNVEIPAGRVESRNREFTVLAQTDLTTAEQFRAIVLRDDGGYLVRLEDVARVELSSADDRTVGRYNGKPAVPLGLVRQATANPLEISKALKETLPLIERQLPAGMKVEIGYDSTIFIDASIDAVFRAILESIALVVVVIFLFLRSIRATLIPLVTIPVSLIGACGLMYLMGFSLNTLTLLAMVLAIGLVVDDAIVMLENIQRHIENGKKPFQAALEGSKEIGFAIVAMTLTLAAVFLPVALSSGATGKLFVEFALALSGAVIVSGFTALTLSPMMCSKLLRHEDQPGRFYQLGDELLGKLTRGYRRTLERALHHRLVVVGAAGLLGAFLILGFLVLPGMRLNNELAPQEDPGFVFTWAQGPEGATLEFMDTYAKQIEAIYDSIPEVDRHFVFVGWPAVTNSVSFPAFEDWSERERSAKEIQGEMFGRFMGIPGVMAFPQIPPALGSFFGQDLEFVVQTTASYDELAQIMKELEQRLGQTPGFVNVRSELTINKPELRVSVNRDKAAAVGADVAEVGRTLETMLGGRQVTRFKRGSEQYDVTVQLDRADRSTPDALTEVYVRGRDGAMVQLANLVAVEENVALPKMDHFNKLRSAQIGASLAPGFALADAIDAAEKVLKDVAGEKATYDLAGQSREFRKVAASTLLLFGLALVFIFLVLAAQFESFIDPLVILLSVPLAIAGAMLALWITGGSINIYSKIGFITLVGLISKHGILIVEFANQLREQGREIRDAVIEAATLRLRPILMTTGAMVLGAIPLALARGAGAEARQDIGWVVVGGLIVGTFFTLFVVPAVYTVLARGSEHQHEDVGTPVASSA